MEWPPPEPPDPGEIDVLLDELVEKAELDSVEEKQKLAQTLKQHRAIFMKKGDQIPRNLATIHKTQDPSIEMECRLPKFLSFLQAIYKKI